MRYFKFYFFHLFVSLVLLTSILVAGPFERGHQFLDKNDPQSAILSYEALIDESPTNEEGEPIGDRIALSYMGVAYGYYLQGDYEESLTNALIIMERFNDSFEAPFASILLGYAYLKIDDFGKAIEYFNLT